MGIMCQSFSHIMQNKTVTDIETKKMLQHYSVSPSNIFQILKTSARHTENDKYFTHINPVMLCVCSKCVITVKTTHY